MFLPTFVTVDKSRSSPRGRNSTKRLVNTMENTLLNIDHLSVCLDTPSGTVQAVRDVSLTLHEGEVLALVGESGCGKSMLCRSIMKLLPQNARITSGSITVNGVDITAYRERDMRRLRGKVFSMIFQDPLTALDPAMPVGRQIAEAVRTHRGRMERSAVDSRVAELLALVGVEPQQGAQYPHQLSGGQRQRCLRASRKYCWRMSLPRRWM